MYDNNIDTDIDIGIEIDIYIDIDMENLLLCPHKYGVKTFNKITLVMIDYNGGHADMRKAMPRDKKKKSMVPLGRDIYPYELEHDWWHKKRPLVYWESLDKYLDSGFR